MTECWHSRPYRNTNNDNVYDPDPEKSYTKAKHLGNYKENVADNLSISSSDETPEVLFPTDEVANEVFNNNFSVLPNFVPMDAFQHIKNSGKSFKKYDNVDVVVNSNDKGLRIMRFVHDLQVYRDPQKNYVFVRSCCWASYKDLSFSQLNCTVVCRNKMFGAAKKIHVQFKLAIRSFHFHCPFYPTLSIFGKCVEREVFSVVRPLSA